MGGYSKHRATAPSPDKAFLKPFSIAGGSMMPCVPLAKPPCWGNRIGARGHTQGRPSCLGGLLPHPLPLAWGCHGPKSRSAQG